ncbi:MAG: hypothetical protein QW040_04130 [Candidatus Aenigmatarchaeota archaeon]
MQAIHSFTSSRRLVRNLQEIDKGYVNCLPIDSFKRDYDILLGLEVLNFIEKEFKPRKEKVQFLKQLREENEKICLGKSICFYIENEYPLSFYFEKKKGRVVQKSQIIGTIMKTNRDLTSPLNPALDIISKIINSYKIGKKLLRENSYVILVTPLGFIPYDPKTLKPLIEHEPFYVPNIFDLKLTEKLALYSKILMEVRGKTPPKDLNFDEEAFKLRVRKEKPIYWRDVERICSKIALQDFKNLAQRFFENNLEQIPILLLSGKDHMNELRKILKQLGLYNSKHDIAKEFLKNNPGDEEYRRWGLGSSRLIGKVTKLKRSERLYLGKLERLIKREFDCEGITAVYNSSLIGEPLHEKKLLKFYEIWLPDSESFYGKPVPCTQGSIFLDFNEEECCSSKMYEEWKKAHTKEEVKKLEDFVKSRNFIQQWTGIIQQIQIKIEKELYPLLNYNIWKEGKGDYTFSNFSRTPVEVAMQDLGFLEGIEKREITTSLGTKATLQELAEVGSLIHDARRKCSVSMHDFTKFTEVPLAFKLENNFYGDYQIYGKADIVLQDEDGKAHICDTKLEAPVSPTRGQRYQIVCAGISIQQALGMQFEGSVHYFTSPLKKDLTFLLYFTPEQIDWILEDMATQVYHYHEMIDNEKKIPKYFEIWKNRMKDPETIEKIIREKLGSF